jgi:hypothetical protein
LSRHGFVNAGSEGEIEAGRMRLIVAANQLHGVLHVVLTARQAEGTVTEFDYLVFSVVTFANHFRPFC